MIAYVWCYLVGIFIHENIKPIKGKFTKGGIILTSLL